MCIFIDDGQWGGSRGGYEPQIASTPTSPPTVTVCYSTSIHVRLELHSLVLSVDDSVSGVGGDTTTIVALNKVGHRVTIHKRLPPVEEEKCVNACVRSGAWKKKAGPSSVSGTTPSATSTLCVGRGLRWREVRIANPFERYWW